MAPAMMEIQFAATGVAASGSNRNIYRAEARRRRENDFCYVAFGQKRGSDSEQMNLPFCLFAAQRLCARSFLLSGRTEKHFETSWRVSKQSAQHSLQRN